MVWFHHSGGVLSLSIVKLMEVQTSNILHMQMLAHPCIDSTGSFSTSLVHFRADLLECVLAMLF